MQIEGETNSGRPPYPAARLRYNLPVELIAQRPPPQRGGSRLLHIRVAQQSFSDHAFTELPQLLPAGCALVVNNSRVIPARVRGARISGAQVELLYHRWLGEGKIEAVVGSNARLRTGELLLLPSGWSATLLTPKSRDGSALQLWRPSGMPPDLDATLKWLDTAGEVPLPPYIHRSAEAAADKAETTGDEAIAGGDAKRYQTVYAAAAGSIAAPTAGLHFTAGMLAELAGQAHPLREVTLHVGLGTFAPLRVDNLADHDMHREAYSVPPGLLEELAAWRMAAIPLCAVGTTSLRVLHTLDFLADGIPAGRSAAPNTKTTDVLPGETAAFIYPGHGTHAADLLLTNFHLPGSTLLALVYAFGGEELMQAAYRHAIEQRYRFFSYGDCMLIDRRGAQLSDDGTALGPVSPEEPA